MDMTQSESHIHPGAVVNSGVISQGTISRGNNESSADDCIAAMKRKAAFLAALAAAQGKFAVPEKNRTAKIKGSTKSGGMVDYSFSYADLASIHTATRPALAACGLSTRSLCLPDDSGEGVWLRVVVAHAEGHEEWSEARVLFGDDIKKFGGNLTYLRRYMLQGMLDVAADDDADEDPNESEGSGWAGSGRSQPAPPTTQRRVIQKGPDQPTEVDDEQPKVSPAQVKMLSGKLAAMQKPESDVFARWNVQSLEDLSAAQYRTQMEELRK
jgi:ERF superfamily